MTLRIGKSKLTAQVALLGNVTPNLRSVCAQIEDHKIFVRFYYDRELSEDDKECAESTMDDIIADLHTHSDEVETFFDYDFLQLGYPEKPPLNRALGVLSIRIIPGKYALRLSRIFCSV